MPNNKNIKSLIGFAVVLGVMFISSRGFAGDYTLLLSSTGENKIKQYDSKGKFKKVFAKVNSPAGMALAPDKSIYVVSQTDGNGRVYKFGAYGAKLKSVASVGGKLRGIDCNAKGDIYYVAMTTERTGRIIPGKLNKFVYTGWLKQCRKADVKVGPDGYVYVTRPELGKRQIIKFSPDLSENLKTVKVFSRLPGGRSPNNMAWGSDGNLYLTDGAKDSVWKVDGKTGVAKLFIDASLKNTGGLEAPEGIAFGPDGNLYVVSVNNCQVLRYNGKTGAFMDIFIQDPDLYDASYLLFCLKIKNKNKKLL